MTNISSSTVKIKELDSSDPLFYVNNGYIVAKRAGIKINKKCPTSMAHQILAAVESGWIEPVAYMTNEEYVMIKLGE